VSASKLRAVLVDDEAPARALLCEYLSADPDVVVVAQCSNGKDALVAIEAERPDVVFLDVQMPRLDGISLAKLLTPQIAVIFCTAHEEFALRAFDVQAVDYLLKPFGRERLAQALSRARERVHGELPKVSAISDRIVIRDGAQVHLVPIERVDYLEAQDDYVAVHDGAHSFLKHQPLAELSESLDPARFVRVHRSYVVNIERIARIEATGKDGRIAVLHDGRTVPVSRTGYERLKRLLG
jgi:two-component system LytT family response regulator